MMKSRISIIQCLLTVVLLCGLPSAQAQEHPNIVLVFLDNFGWGEPGFNGGGIIRGAATPRLDKLAREGLRLSNFNVEVPQYMMIYLGGDQPSSPKEE